MSDQETLLTTRAEARRYLWSWFGTTLLFAVSFLTAAFSPTNLFLAPAALGAAAGAGLERLAKQIVLRSHGPQIGFFSRQFRAWDIATKLEREAAFKDAVRLMEWPEHRWLVFRRLALTMAIMSFVALPISWSIRN